MTSAPTAGLYPSMLSAPGLVEPVPRRVRASLTGTTVLDTTRAVYVWEWAGYPQFYIPAEDVTTATLTPSGPDQDDAQGTFHPVDLRVGETTVVNAGRHYVISTLPGVTGTVRFRWEVMDCWFEEDEEVFVHPRNPYTRVDALRSSRPVRVEVDGRVVAESQATVMVFETGLPTRYYFDRHAVDFTALTPSGTVTACPYKGVTSDYWSVTSRGALQEDLAWSYAFPTRQLLAIAGLVAFYNEKVDLVVDGRPQPRPVSPFS
ncbi:DUF427 domain-containing protein [Glaciihabitans sp. UYNi722]|uniref:DUF427 domain-containing protein n=1 Tax=Glaciihabitans sp. UYNi722 TaxID=3156344 RepID=UPI0033907F34